MSRRARTGHAGARMSVSSLVGATVVLAAIGIVTAAQPPDGAFSDTQAASGQAAYADACAECHGATLRGGAHGPELTGVDFMSVWATRTTRELFDHIKRDMPPGLGGSLSDETYLNVVALILQSNGRASGPQALRVDSAITIGAAPAADSDPAPPPAQAQAPQTEEPGGDVPAGRTTRFGNRQVTSLTPVTDALLWQPPAADWLTWRRTLDNHGYSPLDQITRDNVTELQLAWVLSMKDGTNQPTPLVHDGVMFLVNPGNVVQALDASSGDVLWEYRYAVPSGALTGTGATRGLALYADKVFLSTYDAAIVALDARTGEQVWRTVKADYTQGFTQTNAPIIANGVVVSGINGCERFTDDGCFITGHDPETGQELWRTSTIALPGDPNSGSWGDVPPHLRGGGDTWIPGSYDPQLDLFYIGTAQAKPWVAASRGMSTSNDALYTNSTLALNPRTGQVEWYFQHVPGETLDMDSVLRARVDRRRRSAIAVHGGQGRHPLEARPSDGPVSRPDGDPLPGRLRVDRPRDRAGDVSTGHSRGRSRRLGAGVSGSVWRAQLAGVRLQPRDRGARPPARAGVHDHDRTSGRPGRGGRRGWGHPPAPRDAGHERQRRQAGRFRRAHHGRTVEP